MSEDFQGETLPAQWVEIPFDLLFENVTSSSLKLPVSDYLSAARHPVVDQGERLIGGFTNDETLLHPSPLPVIVFGDHTRCVKFVNVPFVQGADGVKVLAPSKQADSRYAYWALKGETIPSKGYARHYALLRKLAFRLPPLREQNRIVEAIESYFTRLDDAVATLERVQRNLRRYRASVLKAAVEGRLVPTEAELARDEGRDYEHASVLLDRILAERRRRWEENELANMTAKGKTPTNDKWKEKYAEPVAPDIDGLPALPDGWCWATLPALGELNRGKSKHRPRNDPRLLGGPYPFIQTSDVRHSDGSINEYSTTYSDFGLSQSRLWPAGTLCITIAANIADTGILNFDACFPDSVVGFLNDIEPTLVRFIELFIRTAKQELERYAPATAQKNINLEVLSGLAVPLPPSAEQVRIVNETDRQMSVIRTLEREESQNSLRVTRLRQSILKWAFEGRLVDQDPNDEPASELLARIQAARTLQPRARALRKSRAAPR